MAELRFRGGCLDLERAGFALAHCSSCHEDVDYGYDLVEIGLPGGEYLAVCCWVASEMGDTDPAVVLAALDAADHAATPAEPACPSQNLVKEEQVDV